MDNVKFQEFLDRYNSLSEEQLLNIHLRKSSLTEEAAAALDYVIDSHLINIEALEKNLKEEVAQQIKEIQIKKKKSKGHTLKYMTAFLCFIFVILMIFPVKGISRIELIISFFMTWGVVLSPPVMIRYFHESPLKKWTAITTSCVLYFLNIIICSGLGSTSYSHAVLLVGAFICFHLLTLDTEEEEAKR